MDIDMQPALRARGCSRRTRRSRHSSAGRFSPYQGLHEARLPHRTLRKRLFAPVSPHSDVAMVAAPSCPTPRQQLHGAVSANLQTTTPVNSVVPSIPAVVTSSSSGPHATVQDWRQVYTVKRQLSETLYGAVFKGTHMPSGRKVALKVSHASQSSHIPTSDNPVNEARVLRHVHDRARMSLNTDAPLGSPRKHPLSPTSTSPSPVLPTGPSALPNVVELLDTFRTEDDENVAVLEYIRGGDLFSYVQHNGRLEEATMRRMMKPVVQAMRFLHEEAGVVHGDITPENLLLRRVPSSSPTERSHDLVLCDFGCARVLGPNQHRFSVAQHGRPGKPSYSAPELVAAPITQGLGGAVLDTSFDFSIDVFSLGVTLFICTFGFPPFVLANAAQDERYAIITAGRAGLDAQLAEWGLQDVGSSDLRDMIVAMLHPDPTQRPSARQLLAHPWFTRQ